MKSKISFSLLDNDCFTFFSKITVSHDFKELFTSLQSSPKTYLKAKSINKFALLMSISFLVGTFYILIYEIY